MFDDISEETVFAALNQPRPWLHVSLVERNKAIVLMAKTETPKAIAFKVGLSYRRVLAIIREFHTEHLRRFRRDITQQK